MRVRLSRWAEMDLIEITDFIALDNPERASEFEDELLEHARKLAQAPLGYVERPELKKGYGPVLTATTSSSLPSTTRAYA